MLILRLLFHSRPILAVSFFATALSCAGTGVVQRNAVSVSDSLPLRRLLARELAREGSFYAPPLPDSIRITESSSRVVPGLIYHWGQYHPPRTVHALFIALVASRESQMHVIRSVEDWQKAAGRFSPRSPADALQACAEITASTSELRSPVTPPMPYSGPRTLDSLPASVPNPAHLRDTLSTPVITADAAGNWLVRFWAIETRDVRKYSCQISSSGVTLAVQETIPMAGYYPY